MTKTDYPITPTSFRSVTLNDGFWLPRLETNRTVTIPAVLGKCRDFGRVENFRRAADRLAGRQPGPYIGRMPFEDTDVYKAVEGASFSLSLHPDPHLDAELDGLIQIIAAAQEPDGYLYTARTIDPSHPVPFAGSWRWSNLVMSHEVYNSGHLYEAACAHYLATGKSALLEVAKNNAALIRKVFSPEGRRDMDGHPIVEMGLARLYRVTGEREYLEQARFFLEQRGRHESRPLYMFAENPGYCQDHVPVREQGAAVGHAVRAMYLYCGMADVAALLPDPSYADAIQEIWRDVVGSKLYVTGGVGARHKGEAFGDAFELPNDTAYAETCASIGSVMWNHRLFLLTGESMYYDVLEQTLYNALLCGVSLSGDQYFYVNPLESDGAFAFNEGSAGRRPWFEVSCCPTNLSRFFPSLPGYVYAESDDDVYVNLFMASEAEVGSLHIRQETDYPWKGSVRIRIGAGQSKRRRLLIRIPGWAREALLGADLYRFEPPAAPAPSLRVNGASVDVSMQKGYAVLSRDWKDGDIVELDLSMPVRTVVCDPRVDANRGRVALQRGPLVYCVEERDVQGPLASLRLETGGDLVRRLVPRWEPDFLGGTTVIDGPGFTAIPYYAWGNRGPGPMRVWLPRP